MMDVIGGGVARNIGLKDDVPFIDKVDGAKGYYELYVRFIRIEFTAWDKFCSGSDTWHAEPRSFYSDLGHALNIDPSLVHA